MDFLELNVYIESTAISQGNIFPFQISVKSIQYLGFEGILNFDYALILLG